MSDPTIYPIGSRVVIYDNWEWPDGTTGTIAEIPGFVRSSQYEEADQPDYAWLYHTYDTLQGPMNVQWVEFDHATDYGSGDGPYRAAVVDVSSLRPLDCDE